MSVPAYICGSYRARILPDGSISYHREILTPDGRELIGREYPNQAYCWFNRTRAASKNGMTHEEIIQAEQASRDLIFDDAYVATYLAEMETA